MIYWAVWALLLDAPATDKDGRVLVFKNKPLTEAAMRIAPYDSQYHELRHLEIGGNGREESALDEPKFMPDEPREHLVRIVTAVWLAHAGKEQIVCGRSLFASMAREAEIPLVGWPPLRKKRRKPLYVPPRSPARERGKK